LVSVSCGDASIVELVLPGSRCFQRSEARTIRAERKMGEKELASPAVFSINTLCCREA